MQWTPAPAHHRWPLTLDRNAACCLLPSFASCTLQSQLRLCKLSGQRHYVALPPQGSATDVRASSATRPVLALQDNRNTHPYKHHLNVDNKLGDQAGSPAHPEPPGPLCQRLHSEPQTGLAGAPACMRHSLRGQPCPAYLPGAALNMLHCPLQLQCRHRSSSACLLQPWMELQSV